jgi:hydroxymethylpyrimidine/phosphomethylpyrimidine kinase
MKSALTIAGFDPSGGAGIQADLKVFHYYGVYGLSVASALTAQNSRGVSRIISVSGGFLRKQLSVLMDDMTPDATKTGMLYSEAAVEAVAHAVKKYSLGNFVIDPVMLSSTGKPLAEKGVPSAIRKKLLPLCRVVTPNIHEAAVLSGIPIRDRTDMERAAVRLTEYGARNVIVTGGHLEKMALDVVYDGKFHYLRGRKVAGDFHGTGCTFSAAVTALLADGYGLLKAAALARAFMKRAFRRSFSARGGLKLFDI